MFRRRNRLSGTSGSRRRDSSQTKNASSDGRAPEQPERLSGCPPGLVAVDDRVDGEHERRRDRDRACDIERLAAERGLRLRQESQREGKDDHADRQVDQEDPVPVERARQHAAEQRRRAAAAGHHEPEHTHCLRAIDRLREEDHDQRERHCRDDGPAESLNRARCDQHSLRAREPACERRQREDRDPDQEQPAVAEEVAEPTTEQQKAAEREDVGVHDPCERRLREAEIGADRRERDVHDRGVQDDHQIAEAQHVEREPATAGGHRRHLSLLSFGFTTSDRAAGPKLIARGTDDFRHRSRSTLQMAALRPNQLVCDISALATRTPARSTISHGCSSPRDGSTWIRPAQRVGRARRADRVRRADGGPTRRAGAADRTAGRASRCRGRT